jgi:hypothetical protein
MQSLLYVNVTRAAYLHIGVFTIRKYALFTACLPHRASDQVAKFISFNNRNHLSIQWSQHEQQSRKASSHELFLTWYRSMVMLMMRKMLADREKWLNPSTQGTK